VEGAAVLDGEAACDIGDNNDDLRGEGSVVSRSGDREAEDRAPTAAASCGAVSLTSDDLWPVMLDPSWV
jgi:hypothetical protein